MSYDEHLISMAGGDGEADVLGEIEARASAATPGPWEFNLGGDWEITANGGSLDYVASISDHGDQSDLDAIFIASARTDIPALIAMAREQRAAIERVKAEGWDRGFSAGWAECSDPGAFVNDVWDAETPNPYRAAEVTQ